MPPSRCFTLAAVLVLAGGCGDREVPAAELGAEAFRDTRLSTSPFNSFSCATCHQVTPPENVDPTAGRIDSGFNLYDTVHRPNWWGGDRLRLFDAINYCVQEFMGGGALNPSDDRPRQLYEFLVANSPSDPAPALPLTVVKTIDAFELQGDLSQGESTYRRACQICHGAAHSGSGAISSRASVIPESTVAVFPTNARLVVVEKIRHGRFFHIGGVMPLYAVEAMTDAQIADVLAYLGL